MQKLISTTSYNELQDDINRLIEWSKKWKLKLITSKCKVMHFGNHTSNSYTMLDFNHQKRKKLEFIAEEKDLGVTIDHKLNFSSHVVTQVKTTNKTTDLIRRSYTHLDMMKNCICGMVDRRKAFCLISSRDHCLRSSPSRISSTPRVQA